MSRGFSLSNSIPKKIETECVQKSMINMSDKNLELYKSSPRHIILSSYRTSIAAPYPRLSRATRIAFDMYSYPLHASLNASQISGAGLSPTEHNAFKSLFKVKEMDDLSGQGCDEVSFRHQGEKAVPAT
jgi:hypothetical protein